MSMWSEIALAFLTGFFGVFILFTITVYIIRMVTEPTINMCKCISRLDGKIVLVTGGNSGIGFETAKELARRGARVIIADVNDSEKSVEDIIKDTGNVKIEYRYLNLANFKSVKAFAEDFNRTVDHLDILVNNAGCLTNDKITEDGINMIMQVNYLGPFLLTKLLLPKLVTQKSRIVIVSSGLYYHGKLDLRDLAGLKPNTFIKTYMNSKLCTVLWTKALAKTLPPNVSALCLHPGMVTTKILHVTNGRIGTFLKRFFHYIVRNPYEGAQTSIHLCVAPDIEHLSGKYFSNCREAATIKFVENPCNIDDLWNETTLLLKEKATINERIINK